MKSALNSLWTGMVRDVLLPEDGLSLDAFASFVRMDPSHVEMATKYLHRRKLIWRSEQRGHVRIYPASMIPGRGRPLSTHRMQSLIPTQVMGLMVDLLPTMGSIAKLMSTMPAGGWQDEPELQAKIRRDMAAEAQRVMTAVRKFVDHRGYPMGLLRKYLWLLAPTGTMAAIVETQPELALGDEPLSPLVVVSKRLAANLPADERVLRYVEAAGVMGIGAYEVAVKTGQAIKREQVEEIALRLDGCLMLYVADARAFNRGPRGIRLYPKKFGKPLIGSDGRRIPPLGLMS